MKALFIGILFFVAATPAMAARDCFWASQVSGFSDNNETELKVRAGRDYYRVRVAFCPDLSWATYIGFDTFGGRVCRGDYVLVLDSFDRRVKERCFIQDIEKL